MEAKELADAMRTLYQDKVIPGDAWDAARVLWALADKLDPPTGGGHNWEEGTFASLNWEVRLRHCVKCGRVEFFENATIGWKKWYDGITEEEDACRDKDVDKK